MSPATDLTARETEVIRILKVLSQATSGFVLIGGYAVNAYGQHRFSVDCDLATNEDSIPVIDATLREDGYTLRKSPARPSQGVIMKDYRKLVGGEPASVELFVNTVVSRTTRGAWTYKFVRENSAETIVVGVTDSTPSRTAERNLLVAMKLHAGRIQDFGDVVMLSEGVDWKDVARCAACGSKEKLVGQIESAISEISSPKFASDLKSTFAMRGDSTFLVKRANIGLRMLRTLVVEEKFRDYL